MVYEFKLPDLGEGVAEGEVLKWMVKEGDQVKEDQPLVEVMTDKVNVQIPSPRTGTVSKIFVKEGDVAKVGDVVVAIAEAGEKVPANPAAPPRQETEPQPTRPVQTASTQTTVQQQRPAGGPVLATPATRKLAREAGVELETVSGSGPHGRVTDDDVRKAAEAGKKPQRAVSPAPLPGSGRPEELVPLKGMRKIIAERMVNARRTAAHVTHVDEVDMTELVLLREALKGSAEKRSVKLTYLPFIIKALIPALEEFPFVNSSLDEAAGNVVLKRYYNFGIAVDTEQGLVVPVVKDADRKDIFEIAREIESLANKAKAGQLALDDVRGSTFTITNIGPIGGLFATPIINVPEAAILGVHKIAKRPVVRGEKIEVRDMMYLSLSFDHRIFDGAYAARFTTRVVETIQDSKKLLSEVL